MHKSCQFRSFCVLFCVFVQGKHQCRALAESMFSPIDGLREINHQLSTGVAQELIHYCNYLGQGVFYLLGRLCLKGRCLNAANLLNPPSSVRLLPPEGDLDSLLENATLENSESSSLSSSQESAEDRSAKTSHSPKDAHAESSKESPGRNDAASSSKDTCQGRKTHWSKWTCRGKSKLLLCDRVTLFIKIQNSLLSGERSGPSSWPWPESSCPTCAPSLTPARKTWTWAPSTGSASSSWSRPQRSPSSRPSSISGGPVSDARLHVCLAVAPSSVPLTQHAVLGLCLG